MSRRPFVKYLNKYFIETGTFQGDGIAEALKAGFPHIISYGINSDFHARAERFKDYPNVRPLHKSSALLAEELKSIDAPATLWLDGSTRQVRHWI